MFFSFYHRTINNNSYYINNSTSKHCENFLHYGFKLNFSKWEVDNPYYENLEICSTSIVYTHVF